MPQPSRAVLVLGVILLWSNSGTAARAADQNFRWKGTGTVRVAAGESLEINRFGEVTAADESAARRRARQDFVALCKDLGTLDEKTIKIELTAGSSPPPPVGESIRVTVQVSLRCLTYDEVKTTFDQMEELENFTALLDVEWPGGTNALKTDIQTDKRKNLQAWEGPVYLGPEGTELTFRLRHRRPAGKTDIGGYPEETVDVGSFRLHLLNDNGDLDVRFQPLEHVSSRNRKEPIVRDGRYNNYLRLSAHGREYYLQLMAHSPEATKRASERDKKRYTPPGPESGFEVFQGSVNAKFRDSEQREAEYGSGSIIVVGDDETAAQEWIRRTYPHGRDVVFVQRPEKGSVPEAERSGIVVAQKYLREHWQELFTNFPKPREKYQLLEGTERINVSAKRGATILDKLLEGSGRDAPRRRARGRR